eukprot:g34250.t1
MPNFLSHLRKKRHSCAFLTHICLESPGQVVGYRQYEELDAPNRLCLRSVDVDRGMFSFLSEVSDEFFSFAAVERLLLLLLLL